MHSKVWPPFFSFCLANESVWQLPFSLIGFTCPISGADAIAKRSSFSLSSCSIPAFLLFSLLSPRLSMIHKLSLSSKERRQFYHSKPGLLPAKHFSSHCDSNQTYSWDSYQPNFFATHSRTSITLWPFSQAIPVDLPSFQFELVNFATSWFPFLQLAPADYIGEAPWLRALVVLAPTGPFHLVFESCGHRHSFFISDCLSLEMPHVKFYV